MLKIVVLDAKTLGADIAWKRLHSLGSVEIFQTTTYDETAQRVENADIVITNKVVLDDTILTGCKNLKLVCVAATGVNNIDIKAAKRLGITVCNAAGYSTKSVVQHTFSMALFLLESMRFFDRYTASGEWSKSDIFSCMDRGFSELDGKRWGIIGMGTIGQNVAKVAKAFGCSVSYYSVSGNTTVEGHKRVELQQLLSDSDVISIHCALSEKSRGLISLRELESMKPSCILLNLGRGGIVEEEAAAAALKKGMIGAIGVDVLQEEPMNPNSPLAKLCPHERLLITPHIGWASKEARERLLKIVEDNIEAFLSGTPTNKVA